MDKTRINTCSVRNEKTDTLKGEKSYERVVSAWDRCFIEGGF